MKKASLLVFIVLFMTHSLAMAAPLEGGNVTMSVPEGWSAEYRKTGLDEFRLTAPENRFRMVIMLGPADGMTPEEGANMIAKKLQGTEPKPTRNPGMYAFEGKNGVRCMTLVQGKRMLVLMESGLGGPIQGQISLLVTSLSSTDKDEQAMFDSLKPFFRQ